MADFEDRNFNTAFTGLITTTGIFAVIGGACWIGFEVLRQMRRLPNTHFAKFWRRSRRERDGMGRVDARGGGEGIGVRNKLTCEDWEMGHLYHARTFHAT